MVSRHSRRLAPGGFALSDWGQWTYIHSACGTLGHGSGKLAARLAVSPYVHGGDSRWRFNGGSLRSDWQSRRGDYALGH